MKVQTTELHDGSVHIVFDDSFGIEIDEYAADSLRRQLQAWKTGEIYEFREGENSFVFVDLARDEDDADHMHISFSKVWYEIPVTTGMELLAELESFGNCNSPMTMTFDEVCELYLKISDLLCEIPQLPSESLSQYICVGNTKGWVLRNVRGERMFIRGDIDPAIPSDEVTHDMFEILTTYDDDEPSRQTVIPLEAAKMLRRTH